MGIALNWSEPPHGRGALYSTQHPTFGNTASYEAILVNQQMVLQITLCHTRTDASILGSSRAEEPRRRNVYWG